MTGSDGLVIVDKDAGMTSHDVVARMRRIAGTRKVGHAGTLDPMATGVLVLGVGKGTRLLHHLVLTDKAYSATIRLGQSTITDDAEGEVVATADPAAIPDDAIRAALTGLTGDIMQVPSSVSAIKVDGQRSYARVRAGEKVELAARPVTVRRFEIDGVPATRRGVGTIDLDVTVECSSGTYVRALARDLGAGLGVGGHLSALRRTRVGPFGLEQAATLAQLAELPDPIRLPLSEAIRTAFPVRVLGAEQAVAVSYGKALEAAGIDGVYGALDAAGAAIALLRESDLAARPVLVFTPAG